MAECIAPYSYSYLTCNMNSNNNDKHNFPPSYPLILAKSHANIETHQTESSSELSAEGVVVTSMANGLIYTDASGYGAPIDSDKQGFIQLSVDDEAGSSMPEEGSSKKSKPTKKRKRKRVESQPSESQPQRKVAKPEDSNDVPGEAVVNANHGTSSEVTPKKKRGRKPKKQVKKKEPSFAQPTKFVKVQGAYFKVCPNCGSVATKLKAKKCHSCQIFFYNHWAKRCRIPPCTNCHFSRRSKPNEIVPKTCERCGHTLPLVPENKSSTTTPTPTTTSEVVSSPISSTTNNERTVDSSTEQSPSSSTFSKNNDIESLLQKTQKLISELTAVSNTPTAGTTSTTTTASPVSTFTDSEPPVVDTISTVIVSQRSAFTRVKTRRRKQIFPDDDAVTRSGRVYKQGSTSPNLELESTTICDDASLNILKQNEGESSLDMEPLKSPSERYFKDNFGADLETIETARKSQEKAKPVLGISNVTEPEGVGATQSPVCAEISTGEEGTYLSDYTRMDSEMQHECIAKVAPIEQEGNRVVSPIARVQSPTTTSDVLPKDSHLVHKDTSDSNDACIDGVGPNVGKAVQHFEADQSSCSSTQQKYDKHQTKISDQHTDEDEEFLLDCKSADETSTSSAAITTVSCKSDSVAPPTCTLPHVVENLEEVSPIQYQSVKSSSKQMKSEFNGTHENFPSTSSSLLKQELSSAVQPPSLHESSPSSPNATQVLQSSDTLNHHGTNPLLRELIKANIEEQQQTDSSQSQTSSITQEHSDITKQLSTSSGIELQLGTKQKQSIVTKCQPSATQHHASSVEPINKNKEEKTTTDKQLQLDSSKQLSLSQQPTVQHLIDQLQNKVQQQQKELETRFRQRIGHTHLTGILKDNKAVISPTESKNLTSSPLAVSQKMDTAPASNDTLSTPVAPLSVIASQLKLPTDLIPNSLTLKTLLVPTVACLGTTDTTRPPVKTTLSSTAASRPNVIASTVTKPPNTSVMVTDPMSLQSYISTGTDSLKITVDRPQTANTAPTSVHSPIIFPPHLTASLLSLLPPHTSTGVPVLQQPNLPTFSAPFQKPLYPPPLKTTPMSTTSTFTSTPTPTSESKPKISTTSSSTLSSLLSREEQISNIVPCVAPITRHVGTSTSPPQLVRVQDVATEKKVVKSTIQLEESAKTNTNTSATKSFHNVVPLKSLKPTAKPHDRTAKTRESTRPTESSSTASGDRNEESAVVQDVPSRQSADSSSPGRFEKLEITCAEPNPVTTSKIRVSLLKPPDSSPSSSSSTATVSSSSSMVNISSLGSTTPSTSTNSYVHVSSGISPPLSTVGTFGAKFQNFAVSPNLSVIATVETQRNTLTKSQRPITQIMPKLAPSKRSPPILKPAIPSLQTIAATAPKTNATSEQQIVPISSPLKNSGRVTNDSIITTYPQAIPTPPPLRSIVTGGVHATVVSNGLSQPPNSLVFASQAAHNSSIVELASNIQQRISKALFQTDPIQTHTLTKPMSVPTTVSLSTVSLSEATQCNTSQSAPIFSNAGVQTTSSGVTSTKGLGGSLSGMKLPISGTFGSLGTSLSSKTLANDSQNATRNTGSEMVNKDSNTPRMKHIVPNVGRVFRNSGGGMVTITVCNTNVPSSIPPASSVGVVNTGPVKGGGVFVTALKGAQNTLPNAATASKTIHMLPSPLQKVSLKEGVQASPAPPAGTSSRGTMTRQVIASTLPPHHELKSASNTQRTSSPDKRRSVTTGRDTGQHQCDLQSADSVQTNDLISSRTRSRDSSTKSVNLQSEKERLPMELDVDGDYSKLVSSETLDSSPSISCSPSDVVTTVEKGANGGGDGNGKSSHSNGGEDGEAGDSGEDGDSGREDDEDDSGEKRKGAGGEEDGFKRRKKKETSTNGNKMKLQLYSVKLKDCFLHHLMWKDYRVVLLVPIPSSSPKAGQSSPGDKSKIGELSGNKGSDVLATPPGGERRSRRKPKIEPLVIHEMEEEELDRLESPSTSSAHINSPCFSVYELRHKIFSEFASNAVYAYTYKNQIKSLKPPIHWVYVLKRMGGMQESCHTCRLLDIDHVKDMSQHYGNMSSLPSTLDELCRNELPKGRKVIDLSDVDPEEIFESNFLEDIPQCSFIEKPLQKKKTAKRKRKTDEVSSSKKPHFDELSQDTDATLNDDAATTMEYSSYDESHKQPDQYGYMSTNSAERIPVKRSPPPLIKHESPSHNNQAMSSINKPPVKKKYCPQCGNQIARKCKKCPSCGKRFGVYTFGRKVCPSCGRVNLARMTACYECGYSMQDAVKALPKAKDESREHLKSKFLFEYRKRRRLHSLPSDYGSRFGDLGNSQMDHLPLPSSAHSSRHPSTGDMEDPLELDEMIPESLIKEVEEPLSAGLGSSGEGVGSLPKTKSKHAGTCYQYGRIPWGDADITCLVDENGLCKFCLQELCSKVLHTHAKSDVFDIVKSLKLPVQQGDNTLLKKLQALGLHSNRSPICRLIAAEELWTLLDALQEPVPEEVHQHLENISASTTPLMSPSHTSGLQSPGLVAGGTSTGATDGAMVDEDEHGFESTLHEVQCSDGQYISILRTWNGEQYACLTEIWRKYFPEVNRNHLTSALKRLVLETHMPTGQQATLLRSAGVISLRGAAGRLMKLESMQTLLDDFSIPLQIGMSGNQENDKSKEKPPPLKPHPPTTPTHTSKPRRASNYGLPTNHTAANARLIPRDKVLASKEDMSHAVCMRNILQAVDHDDLRKLLEKSKDEAESVSASVDEEVQAAATEFDNIQQLMHSRRELCHILSNEIGYLTVTNHSFMAELVRVNRTGKQTIQDVEHLAQTFDFTLK